MNQGDEIIANQDFSFKVAGARGRPVTVRKGDIFWITSPSYENKESVKIERKGKGHINTGYCFDIETINTYFFTEETKHVCSYCKGSGRINFSVTDGNKKTESEMSCFTCKGTGTLDNKQKMRYDAEQKWLREEWCHCGNHSGNTKFHDDTKYLKHHWTCDDCSKIVQYG